ncbi:MAG: hypothetical protein HQK83_03995 [Fibrobacteria bacterium]|nr:hypothetical protein [Fibrobacteria bacterium]
MLLPEFYAKNYLKEYGIKVPESVLDSSLDQGNIVDSLPGSGAVYLKGQVPQWKREKSGYIIKSERSASFSSKLESLKERLKKHSNCAGILIEEDIPHNLAIYLSLFFDSNSGTAVLLCLGDGGENIEEKFCSRPNKIFKRSLPLTQSDKGNNSLIPHEIIADSFNSLCLPEELKTCWESLLFSLAAMFCEKDCLLLEINPLAVKGNNFYALDCKMFVDDNSCFRQVTLCKQASVYRTAEELAAARYGMSFAPMEGTIGCLVNGAGLALATADYLIEKQLSPANFLDIGGRATVESIKKGLEIICANKKVRVVLVNVFGGIINCGMVAEAVLEFFRALKKKKKLPFTPILVLRGAGVEEARTMLAHSDIRLANSLSTAVAEIRRYL